MIGKQDSNRTTLEMSARPAKFHVADAQADGRSFNGKSEVHEQATGG